MKDYHFEPDNRDLDETIRLDDINEELKKLEKELPPDDLGDVNEFLNAFESERFDPQGGQKPQDLPPKHNGNGKTPAGNRPPSNGGNRPTMNKKNMALFAALAVIVAVFFFGLASGLFSDDNKTPTADTTPMLIHGILDGGELIVYDIELDINKSISYTEETVITDPEGRVIPISDLAIGNLAIVGVDKTGKTALTIDLGGEITTTEATDLTVNPDRKTLESEKTSYSYDPKAMFYWNEEELSPEDLEPCDLLLLKSIDETVWSVEVLEYHGFISVENKDTIINGTFKLDEEEPQPLSEVSRIAAKEGTHTISISGDNIEKRNDSIFVATGEEYIYDLSKAQEKVGVIIVNANVSDYSLHINGTLVDSTEPCVLPLGEYDILVTKDGYTQWSQHVALKGDTLSVKAVLEKEIQYGTLTVTSDVNGAKVLIDQKEMGIVPLEINLPYGTYHLAVEAGGYDRYENTIVVSNSSLFVKAELE